mgnify:CR=1 FL=1
MSLALPPKRRETPDVAIGTVTLGSRHPIIIQSMTNTPTASVAATVAQIKALADAGSELVRITVNDADAMQAIPEIHHQLQDAGYTTPLIGDFHFNGHVLLTNYPESADLLAKFRMNPGNVGRGDRRDTQFEMIIKAAMRHNKPVRIGVNWGSLDPIVLADAMDHNQKRKQPLSSLDVTVEAMITSALQSEALAYSLGLKPENCVISVKLSHVRAMVQAYRTLASKTQAALHVGLTEAGSNQQGLISSALAIGALLQDGIGDTIRISLTPTTARTEEVAGCKQLLQSLGLRNFSPSVVSCPGCGRTDSEDFLNLAKRVQAHIDKTLATWRVRYPGVEALSIAVMGCVVNGPGESKHADIGISLPGISETPRAPVYIDGAYYTTLKGDSLETDFIDILETYIKKRYA